MNQTSRWLSVACAATLLLALGCASTPQPEPAAPDLEPPISRSEKGAELSLGGSTAPPLTPVYFDTDSALLRADVRESLKRHASAIQQHPEWGALTIEGHCDERGSQEYNLGLGNRRAAAVVRYLTDLGVPAARLDTRSLGEEHPAVLGHDESAWSRNRRSELRSGAYDAAQR